MTGPTPVRAGEDAGRDLVEDGCRVCYGRTWDGPREKMPSEGMKDVWRELVAKAQRPAAEALAAAEAEIARLKAENERLAGEVAEYTASYRMAAGCMTSTTGELIAAEATVSALRERVARLEEALRPFCFGDPTLEQILFGGMPDSEACNLTVRLRDTRRARAALTEGAPTDV